MLNSAIYAEQNEPTHVSASALFRIEEDLIRRAEQVVDRGAPSNMLQRSEGAVSFRCKSSFATLMSVSIKDAESLPRSNMATLNVTCATQGIESLL